ncbi:hypothetical protein N8A98_06795 [Devosia neptuniae]|uniref:Uncharacterized protein n=1 Tax=Devosia neptuniae TaxID=191302 RepID=A0ABY6CFA8_9HYPH|nr:hypothetical protein [Devosia neptuniae]UXN70889.1 hypothetical protein N8A98_06795 [Devosia neptuniae]
MLPLTVSELAAGHRVQAATLFEFQFASGTQRFWDGHGYLAAGGHEWQGFGEMGSVSGLEQSRGLGAPQTTFKLSGVDSNLLSIAVNSAAEVTGRPCAVHLQFLSSAYTALDTPIAIWAGTMDTLSFVAGVKDQSITLSAETLFVDRVRAPWGLYTDTDQRARWPGDRGFEFMASLLYKTVNWLRG